MQTTRKILNPNHPAVKVFDLIGYLVILSCFGFVTSIIVLPVLVESIPNAIVRGIVVLAMIIAGGTILNRVIALRRFVADSLPKPEKMPARWTVIHNTNDNRKDQ